MNASSSSSAAPRLLAQKPVLIGLVIVALVVIVAVVIKKTRPAPQESNYYTAKRGDFLISVVEGGTIQAVNEVVVRSEVEGTARIIYIVPEGTTVKKGQVLVELDSSAANDAVNQQQINVEKAQFALIQAEQQLAIQKSTVDSEVAAATLKVEFAQSDLEKYIKGEMAQTRRNALIEISNVVENLEIARERLVWSEKLEKNGYETKANLDKDRLTVSQTTLKLEQAQTALKLLDEFDIPKKKRTLESALKEAQDELERVKMQGERKLAQYKADVETQKKTLDLSQSKLERDKKQLASCKILAPQDGLVVYGGGGDDRRFSSESMIEEGAIVRYRQQIIKLPDISEMKLTVRIHESHINQVHLDQPAYVVLDAMPDRRFQGYISKVAPLPDTQARFGNPNLKVYATEIFISDKLPNVKPGVSARAEIVITNLQKVLTVPIQSVTTRKGKQVVYLAGHTPQAVPVTVGMYNVKFIEVLSGLKEGDRVLLSPPLDTQEKDLAGAVIADGEKVPTPNGTNRAPRTARMSSENGDRFSPGDSGDRPSAGFGGSEGNREPNMRSGTRRDNPAGIPNTDLPGGSDTRETGFNREGGGGGGGFGRTLSPDILKQFDANGDGQLDETERAAMRQQRGRGQGGPGGGGGFTIPPEILTQFDANGDGQLDESERNAMRAQFGRGRRPGGSTNSAPGQFPASPDASR